MKKFSRRVLPVVMACLMPATTAVPAFAAKPAVQTSPTTIVAHMSPAKTVYPIGTKSFYKVDGTVVSYADRDDGTSDGATVSSDVDKAANQDNTMGSDFYLNIEKDAIDPDGIPKDPAINASGECYVNCIDGEWSFKAAGVLNGYINVVNNPR